MRIVATILVLVGTLGLPCFPVLAQDESLEDTRGPGDPELRQALRTYLERRLRADLGLTDEQAAAVFPELESMQQEQAEARRERQTAMRELRRLYDEGASDVELEEALSQLDTIEEKQRLVAKRRMSEIEGSLSVRQRVGLRFFLIQVREEVRGRVEQLRRRSGRGARNGPSGRGGGPGVP